MSSTPPFPELLPLIESRSAALSEAAREAPDLAAPVPGCPDWSLRDLVTHLGRVQRFWAVTVADGDPSKPPTAAVPPFAGDPGQLLEWYEQSTPILIDALRAAGPDAPSWTWWAASGAPMTTGAVARHQVQEAAVHAFDAQQAIGRPEPIPAAVAVDGVSEFLSVSLGSRAAWPHRPARIEFHALEGPSWTLDLSPSGVTVGSAASGEPVTRFRGPASELLLVLHRRIPLDEVRIEGDRTLAEQLRAWSKVD